MSDDLTRRINEALRDTLGFDMLVLRPNSMADASRAIASLIAEREAAARREALKEAARWHDLQAEFAIRTRDTDVHTRSAAAIRSLAAKEADNG